MKTRKLLATAVAGTLVAAQMVMPVMAAADGGSFDVDVTTKTGVLRVVVPTSMAIAVDQFEITETGTQIAAGEFGMTNQSEMDVKVTVTSTVELAEGISLVNSKNGAETSTGDEAWLGAAAMTSDGVYDDTKTGTNDDPVTETQGTLTEANANVTTFGSDKKAVQTFYLNKATGATKYKLGVPDSDGKVTDTFAKFYELTELTSLANDNDLQAIVDENDVYVVESTNVGTDTTEMTKIAKGGNGGTLDTTNKKYYTAADNSTSVATGKLYVYAEMSGTDGGKAGFTYVGKLSNNKETWTADDIKKISIAYTIAGVTGTNYTAVEDDCIYGFYKAPVAITLVSGNDTTDVVLDIALPEGKTLNTNFAKINGVDASAWSSFKTNVIFNTANKTVTVKASAFAFNSVKAATTDHEYTIVLKDTDGTEYSAVLNLAP